MAKGFKCAEREQQFLLPPSMLEWLPETHPVWLVIALVDGLDLRAFERRYRLGEAGREPFAPSLMVALLLWCYSSGVRSSRMIERACVENVACRVICGGVFPDHTTIAKFRQRHEVELEDLFVQVLSLCTRAGLVQLGLVALDGTKVAADASVGANRTRKKLAGMVEEMLADAAEQDRVEQERFGEGNGSDVPQPLADPENRREQVRRLLDDQGDGKGGSVGSTATSSQELVPLNKGGSVGSTATSSQELVPLNKGGKSTDVVRLQQHLANLEDSEADDPRVNLTDPHSALMHAANGGYLQGYNCQVLCTPGQVVLATSVSPATNDYGQLAPMLALARSNLSLSGVDTSIGVVVADAGYCSDADLRGAESDPATHLVAVSKARDIAKQPPRRSRSEEWEREQQRVDAERRAEQRRRAEVFALVAAGTITQQEAGRRLGLSAEPVWRGFQAWRRGGVAAIGVRRAKNPLRKPAPETLRRQAMAERVAEPGNHALYKQRGPTVETFYGNAKHNKGFRRFSRRGTRAVNSEWSMLATVNNLEKLIQSINNLARMTYGG